MGYVIKNRISRICATAILALLITAMCAVYMPVASSSPINFYATISPTHVAGKKTYVFTITVTNNGSAIGINKIDIICNDVWGFNALVDYSPATWTTIHSVISGKTVFNMTGPNIVIGRSASISVNLTTPDKTYDPAEWKVIAWDANGVSLGEWKLKIVVDNVAPTVSITKPDVGVYKVGSGNYIWINGTVEDNLNITKYGVPYRYINDTRFTLYDFRKVTDTRYNFFFRNTTAIRDGTLRVKVIFRDAAGNENFAEKSATIDNTPPALIRLEVRDDKVGKLEQIGNTFYMSKDATKLNFTITFREPHTFIGKLYVNNTLHWTFTSNGTSTYYDVSSKILAVVNNITIIDRALPKPNNTLVTGTYYVVRDREPPSAPTVTAVEPICGGVIIRGLTATDNVAIHSFKVYVGTSFFIEVPYANLTWSKLSRFPPKAYAFSGILVLNLTDKAGQSVSITIKAVDFARNDGPSSSPISFTVPDGRWYPIELAEKWNLISLPLVPKSTARTDVLSRVLRQGSAGVLVTYAYDQYADTWIVNPDTMTDGFGYWVYMNAYDVLIVEGYISALPPALPPHYTYTTGWVLAGYKSIYERTVSEYLDSLPTGSYFSVIFVWNAASQAWELKSGSDKLKPGQGFWMYMYSTQTLIPPIP